MKIIPLIVTFLLIPIAYSNEQPLLIGVESSYVIGGEQLSESKSISGLGMYLNDGFSIGPTIEKLINPKFSIRGSIQIQINSYVVDENNQSFSMFSIPTDIQGFYEVTEGLQIGTGLNVILSNSLKDTYTNVEGERETIHYQFNNSIAPIFTIRIHDSIYNPFRYVSISYSPHTYSIKNYQSDMVLDQQDLQGNKFIFSIGMAWGTK